MKTKISPQETLKHLNEQYLLLKRACERYDEGDILEAKNISLRIRILCHNTKNSISLLKQVALAQGVDIKIDSFQKPLPPGCIFFIGPTVKASRQDKTLRFVPMLDFNGRTGRELSYEDWWNQIMLIMEGKHFSRKDIILTYTDQDGGAHVDPSIDEDYKSLTEGDLLKIKNSYQQDNQYIVEKDIPHVVVRESAHFLLKAIEKYYGGTISK